MKSCMDHDLCNWLRVNDQWKCRNKMVKKFLNWKAEIIKFKVQVTYLLKLKSNSLPEVFQRCFDDCYSFSDDYGRCWCAYLRLKWSESFRPSPTATYWSVIRFWCWCYYRCVPGVWITFMRYMDDVWGERLKLARVEWKFGG